MSAEDRKDGLPRISELATAPAAVRFLSIEPLLEDLGDLDLQGIDGVIVGGESGPGAGPMEPAWVRRVHKQCRWAKVPFFFKQWGGVRKRKVGLVLDGRIYKGAPPLRCRPVPTPAVRKRLVAEFTRRYQHLDGASAGRSRLSLVQIAAGVQTRWK